MGAGRIRHDHQAGSAEAALAVLLLVLLTGGCMQCPELAQSLESAEGVQSTTDKMARLVGEQYRITGRRADIYERTPKQNHGLAVRIIESQWRLYHRLTNLFSRQS